MKTSVLFLIHDLGQGGAEKVLVNLVNHLDREKFDISVTTLFGGGINEQFLSPDIRLRTVFPKAIPGNSKWMKLFTPKHLHRLCVKEHYDVEVSYLEGPSARIISGCDDANTKKVSWIHVEQHTMERLAASFRSPKEAVDCYQRFDKTIFVSEYVKNDFCTILNYEKDCEVLYNTVDSDDIRTKASEEVSQILQEEHIKLVAVGTLKKSKGYDRMLRIAERLKEEQYQFHLFILGEGPLREKLEKWTIDHDLSGSVSFLGYDTNPYKYVSKCDLMICSSLAEGFSTAVTEALIVGTPVCTVDVSGMKELLGENNEFGVVTENNEEALYLGIKDLLDNPEELAFYHKQASCRGESFSTEQTVKAVEQMLLDL